MFNSVVSVLLRSPFHRLVSKSMDLVRYTGRRTGRRIATPTQYAKRGEDVVILVGRPEGKTWWHNFESDCNVDVLMKGRWNKMTARAVIGRDEPETIRSLLEVYAARFPKALPAAGSSARDVQIGRSVIVLCRPR